MFGKILSFWRKKNERNVFAVVVTVFGVVNIWLVNVHAKKIDEVFERTRILNENLDTFPNDVRA